MIAAFRNLRLLIVGDLMLDEYLDGTSTRMSPESAAVPVVLTHTRTTRPGGAANAAVQAATLGAVVRLVGTVGADPDGVELVRLLQSVGVDTSGVVPIDGRPTTRKTRVRANAHPVIRLDREDTSALPEWAARSLRGLVETHANRAAVALVSDYGKGVVTRELVADLVGAGVPIVADPKGTDATKYAGCAVLKPNRVEAESLLGREVGEGDELAAAAELLDLAGVGAVVLTAGPRGMFAAQQKAPPFHVPAVSNGFPVVDVCGAGDAVAAVLTLVIGAGAGLVSACRMATAAAGVVIRKSGTATATPAELGRMLA